MAWICKMSAPTLRASLMARKVWDDGLKRLFLGRRKRDEPNTLPLLQAILHIIGASHHCHVPSSFRQAREQFLTMRLTPPMTPGMPRVPVTTIFFILSSALKIIHYFYTQIPQLRELMRAFVTRIKETLQYVWHSIVDVPFCPLALADRQKETLNTLRGYLRTII